MSPETITVTGGCADCRRHTTVTNLFAVLRGDVEHEDVHACKLPDGRVRAMERPETYCGEHEPERRAAAKARAGRGAA